MLQGTVPILPDGYLSDRLQPHQRTLIQLALDRELPTNPETVIEIDQMLDALELTGVWGKRKEGYAFTRAFFVDGDRMFTHVKVHSWDDPTVPVEVRERTWTWVDSIDELLLKVMAQCNAFRVTKGDKAENLVVTEDHPEMDALAFRVVEANEAWMIKRTTVLRDVEYGTSAHPAAVELFQTASGRRTLCKVLAQGLLTNTHTQTETLMMHTPVVEKAKRNAEQRIRVDLTAKPLAEAFLKRGKGRR